MPSLLQRLNTLPFRHTIEQYYHRSGQGSYLDEHALNSAELWDALRKSHPNFAIPEAREEWLAMIHEETLKDGLDGQLPQRADAIAALLERDGVERVHSLGVGSAGLEYHLKTRAPKLHLTVSEYAPENVKLLKQLFTECDEILQFDLFGNEWSAFAGQPSAVIMLNRLDPLFSNDQWTEAFAKMGEADVSRILYIPAWILTAKFYLQTKRRHLGYRFSKTPTVFTGWARTQKVQEAFWSEHYRHECVPLAGLTGFLLTKRS